MPRAKYAAIASKAWQPVPCGGFWKRDAGVGKGGIGLLLRAAEGNDLVALPGRMAAFEKPGWAGIPPNQTMQTGFHLRSA